MKITLNIIKILSLLFFSTSAMAAEHLVDIKAFQFVPNEISVQPGDTIVFTNRDSAPHSVVPKEDSSGVFEPSSVLSTDDQFTMEIPSEINSIEAGCGVHPRMPSITILIETESQVLLKEIRHRLNKLETIITANGKRL